ncbi:isoprenylcysteine carboxylmethyltransferase family protein [Leptolyngbya sp. FACHB-36]|uniref:methyltransferase family protein n=1 Tax=Leptolyngbya sp. FACHB-36 TaxID=2692808 RepID=UPI001680B3DB|nr:isoprenylcysteine carboxylmethyltransferase family protein [Leptolyngbya sp. FACHB-36]MBD2020228.1 isoprenylcysteine carboxylmethyltransferase family protein [Leptolyngbya sp. FACHB-36]
MKLLTNWGFSTQSWQGQRGEYWVLVQAVLLIAFAVLPVYRLDGLVLTPSEQVGIWIGAAVLGLIASVLLLKSLLDLGRNLTPLPHPRDDGELVQSGVYGVVRHPLYSGVVLAALSWTLYQVSLSHLVGTIVLFLFFNAKASREERWLRDRHPEYETYQSQVKKLIPWLY